MPFQNKQKQQRERNTERTRLNVIYLPRHQTYVKYTAAKKKLVQTLLSPTIQEFYKSAICMDVEPIINESWMNKLDLENMITLLCGVIASLLPFIMDESNRYFDFGQYHQRGVSSATIHDIHVYNVWQMMRSWSRSP